MEAALFLPISPGFGMPAVARGTCVTTLAMLWDVVALNTLMLWGSSPGSAVLMLLAGWASTIGPRAMELTTMECLSAGRHYLHYLLIWSSDLKQE